ncbi:MAG: hypothetical protein KDA28_04895 [Phycisphaerales bacterium]|nr:hypothetical protein [Phycisphaerales bacterium]
MPEKTAEDPITLPTLVTTLDPEAIVARLRTESQKGRLPGFETDQGLFQIEAVGMPFPSTCIADAEHAGNSTTLRFRTRLQPAMPWVLACTLILTIEPGRYFTDQFIPGDWGWIPTAWWYYPLTILPAPFIWRSMIGRSRRTGLEAAREIVERVRTLLDATTTDA